MPAKTYRVLALIVTSAILPSGGAPVTMPVATRVKAMNSAARLGKKLQDASNGMGTVATTIKVVTETITSAQYDTTLGYPFPAYMAAFTRDTNKYDFIAVYTSAEMTTMGGYIGWATPDGFWVNASDNRSDLTGTHELGHCLEMWLRTKGFTNWPTCADAGTAASMHCGAEYGFGDDMNLPWFNGYFRATLADGRGMTQAAWNIATPTEDGARTKPYSHELVTSPWGRIGVIPIAAPT